MFAMSTASFTEASITSQRRPGIDYFTSYPIITPIYFTFVCLFTVVGNIGNVMVLGAIAVDRRLWKIGNIFICNLAVADLCVTLVVNPASIAGVLVGNLYFDHRPALCHFLGSICLTGCVCSLWSIAAISVNRYVLICHNHYYSIVFTKKNSIAMCLGLWFGAFLLDIPNFLDWGDHTFDLKTMACSYDRTASYSYTVFFISLFVTLPLVSVCFCSLRIYQTVRKSKLRVRAYPGLSNGNGSTTMCMNGASTFPGHCSVRNDLETDNEASVSIVNTGNHLTVPGTRPSHAGNQSISRDEQSTTLKEGSQIVTTSVRQRVKVRSGDVKLARTLFIVFVVFMFCWCPYALICLIDIFDEAPHMAYAVAILFAHTNSCPQ